MILTLAQFHALPTWVQLTLFSVGDVHVRTRGWDVI